MKQQYREDEITFEDIARSMASYKGHLKHGHTYKLRKKVFRDFVLTKEKKETERKGEQDEEKDNINPADSINAVYGAGNPGGGWERNWWD